MAGIRRRLGTLFGRQHRDPVAEGNEYYQSQPSCQIPYLNFIIELFLGTRSDGIYVEVGAFDGLFASNTWGLAVRGWKGYLVEPVPALAEACRANYRDFKNVSVCQHAIAGPGQSSITLSLAGTLTTASIEQATEYASVPWALDSLTGEVIDVPALDLDTFLESRGVQPDFDILVVDVEGFESTVFQGFDIARWRPRMMIVELADVHPDLTASARKDALLGKSLVQAGFTVVFKDSINTVLVRTDVWRRAYEQPLGPNEL